MKVSLNTADVLAQLNMTFIGKTVKVKAEDGSEHELTLHEGHLFRLIDEHRALLRLEEAVRKDQPLPGAHIEGGMDIIAELDKIRKA